MLSVKQFTFILFILLVTAFYTLFQSYFVAEREKASSIILDGYRSELSELTYILSDMFTKSDEDVSSAKAILGRYAANNDMSAALILADDTDLLVTTDPRLQTLPVGSEIIRPQRNMTDIYALLLTHSAIEGTIRYYKGKEIRRLRLLIVIDKKAFERHFEEHRSEYLLLFGLLPLLMLALLWIVTYIYIRKPLELLRQYAYYQSKVPTRFRLKELEAIRASLNQTFHRLDEEKKELYHQARTDDLSGLPNRNALEERLEWLIAESSRSNSEFALLFLDIDHFKMINDSLGHKVGDILLRELSAKIHEAVRTNDIIARIGGDEFVIVLSRYSSYFELTQVIERIQRHVQQEWVIDTHPLYITGSIGVAFYPKDGIDMISLMKNADIAMYEAKKNGRNQYHMFTESLHSKIQHDIHMDKEMRRALRDDEYTLYYQPKYAFRSGEIIGAEALVRWMHPTQGMITPNSFIPLAEKNGFIIELGAWVLEHAIKQQLAWKKEGICDLKISINVSTKQLLDANFVEKFKEKINSSAVDPKMIEIEITEYIFMENSEKNLRILQTLHAMGINIALDDFGTGYSSLSYLKTFPIDTLKIDKSFIDDLNTPAGSTFVETIIKMGQTLDLEVISEGVETQAQHDMLKSLGCDHYQGYYRSRPLSAKAFAKLYVSSKAKV